MKSKWSLLTVLPFIIHTAASTNSRPSIPSPFHNSNTMPKEKKWFPLESNPTLLNRYITNLGFSTARYGFVDVYSTDEWALDMIKQPVLALIVLFPMSSKIMKRMQEMHKSAAADESDGVWYIKQRISNACGTIAILHALSNTPKDVKSKEIASPSWIAKFLEKCTTTMPPTDKATMLENDSVIESFHEAATSDPANQTNRPDMSEQLDLHFVTFICVNGKLYELDGRIDGPVCHGSTSEVDFLKDACGVVREWMEADKDELRFNMMALAPVAADK